MPHDRERLYFVDKILKQNGLYNIIEEDNGYTLEFWFNDDPERFYKILKGRDGGKFKFMAGHEPSIMYLEEGDVLLFKFEEEGKVWFTCPKILIGVNTMDAEDAVGFTQYASLSQMAQEGLITNTLITGDTGQAPAEAPPPKVSPLSKEVPTLPELEEMDIEYGSFTSVRDLFDLLRHLIQSLGLSRTLSNIAHITRYRSKQNEAGIRMLKVTRGCYPPSNNGMDTDPAFIKLCGRWLEKAGFERGQFVQVITIKGMMLIVPVHPPVFDQDLGEITNDYTSDEI
ncbi:type I toxin-antitoxin system SymE family toxin [Pseudoflavitalea sp. X16]|uniref:type I toxin-antitoxin system SymE family toxin n=1 Tax=Paraflavitalea devenefica TaxID=2716334 RepID=UPI001423E7AF|nr:type I toxin-antitoxin system SymE family toxin [Paraflavitalea devenefica]NII24009.1 type I toxin-antitoxin system SymE family toxin [Paraflavitalea devenefica]